MSKWGSLSWSGLGELCCNIQDWNLVVFRRIFIKGCTIGQCHQRGFLEYMGTLQIYVGNVDKKGLFFPSIFGGCVKKQQNYGFWMHILIQRILMITFWDDIIYIDMRIINSYPFLVCGQSWLNSIFILFSPIRTWPEVLAIFSFHHWSMPSIV